MTTAPPVNPAPQEPPAPTEPSDDRIRRMRSAVLRSVDADVDRRRRRARVAGGLAAAVVVVGLASVGIGVANRTGTSPGSSSSSAAGSSEAPSGALQKAPTSLNDPARQVVTTGTVNLTVKDPRAVATTLSTYVESIGGRVDKRTRSGGRGDVSASLQIRVPRSAVTRTITHLATYGRVDDVSLDNKDVTAASQDLDARIGALRLSITRLEKIMSSSGTSAELIRAESALTQRQEQLESLVAQKKGTADQVALSTISIDLSQQQARHHDSGGFVGGVRNGWNGLTSTVGQLAEAVGVALPWLLVGLVGAVAYRLVRRRRG